MFYDNNPDESLYYCVVDSENDDYCLNDFVAVKNDFLDIIIPEGMEKRLKLSFLLKDSAGNISEISEPLDIFIDRKPPIPPEILFEENLIIINSQSAVEFSYFISRNGKIISENTGSYIEPVELNEILKNGDFLSVYAENHDESGNQSRSVFNLSVKKDDLQKETFIYNDFNKNIYSGENIIFYAYPEGINDDVYYLLTKTTANGNSQTEGPYITNGQIIINGIENEESEYNLEVYSVDRIDGSKSNVSSYNFIIDNKNPSVPAISGIKNGGVFGQQVLISPVKDSDSKAFITYSNSESDLKKVLSNKSISFNQPILFDIEDGTEKDFFIQTGAVDSAGNSSVNNEIFNFRIDKKRPHIYSLETIQINNNSVKIVPKGADVYRYFFEFGPVASPVKNPDKKSESFSDELILTLPSDSENNFLVKIAAEDHAGNLTYFPISTLVKKNIIQDFSVSSPEIFTDTLKNKLIVFWSESESKIFYRISDKPKSVKENEFLFYEKPFSIRYSTSADSIYLSYYIESSSGKKSSIKNLEIDLPNSGSAELAEGIKNNNSYNEDLKLRKISTDSIIRYEISTDTITGHEVDVFSPELTETLDFIIEEGESINFIVNLKEFKDSNDLIGGSEQTIRFTIDKQLPAPPTISGVADGEYYLSDCRASLNSPEGNIYYSVNSLPSLNNLEYEKYTGTFDIISESGTFQSFEIRSYSEDYAGNRSPEKVWNITIDKEIIYVSEFGMDYATGTRSQPFRTIDKAVEHVKKSGRKTIFLAEGTYSISSSAVIDEKITISGGFNSDNWFEQSGKSVITVGDQFIDNNPVFYIYGGELNLNGTEIRSSNKYFTSMFYINKGNLSINNCLLDIDCLEDSSIIIQNYGMLEIYNSDIKCVPSESALIRNNYGTLNINKTNFTSKSSSSDNVIIYSENCIDFNLSGSEFIIKGGMDSSSLIMNNCSSIIKNCKFTSEKSDVSSTFIKAVGSRIKLLYSKFTGFSSNRITNGIISEDSNITASDNIFELSASTGIIGFNFVGGDNNIYNNRFFSSPTADFSYIFLCYSGEHSIENNIFEISFSDDILFMRNKNSNADIFNNTINSGNAGIKQIMFEPEGDSVTRIINNIIFRTDDASDAENTILFQRSKSMVSVKNNCFHNWNKYMDGIAAADNLVSLDLLDGIYSAGQFSDNIEEAPAETFSDDNDYRLSSKSGCIDTGYDLTNIITNSRDFEGNRRPNQELNRTPSFDIGAFEYYE